MLEMKFCECGCNTFRAKITDGDATLSLGTEGEVIEADAVALETGIYLCINCTKPLVKD